MKKLFLALAIFGFVAFGVIGIQDMQASTFSIEMMKFDKDPKKDKDGDKKVKETKAKTETEMKAQTSSSKDGCCASYSSSVNKDNCCSKSGDDCSKGCPDKK